jgi:integrase
MRHEEALGNWIDLDLNSGRLRAANNFVEVAGQLHEGPPKTKAGRRTMTLPPSVVNDIRLHVVRNGASPYLFTARNGTLLHSETWRSCTWGPAVAATGVDPLEIARRAGHSSVSFTYVRYGHLFPEIDG